MPRSVAYLIVAHTDPVQCSRLVSRLLLDPSAHIFIHVDLKSKDDFSNVFKLGEGRVHATNIRYEVSWSGFSTVRAIVSCMKEALAFPCNFGYLVLISGLDYPLRHPEEIKRYLYSQTFIQHINRVNIADSPEHYLRIAKRFTFRDAWLPAGKIDKGLRKVASYAAMPFSRKLPPSLMICTGSSWWALTAECSNFAVKAYDDGWFESYFKWLHCPEEHYFHTLVQNSPFSAEAHPVLTYTGRGMWKTANLHVIHHSLRKIYTEADFREVVRSGKCFVRKVTTAQSTKLLDLIDAAVENVNTPVTLL